MGSLKKTGNRQPARASAEVLGADGWFRTGDIGRIDEAGRLLITDRKKDIIITAGGKNVAPQNIENELKALCPLVSQAVVVGDRRKYLAALVTLSRETARDWVEHGRLTRAGEAIHDEALLARHPEVVEVIQRHVDRLNEKLPSYETIKRFAILPADFTQEPGELTPSLKVKGKLVLEQYRAEVERLYRDEAPDRAVATEHA
jgi:long-chain acyl-CoA synthetase